MSQHLPTRRHGVRWLGGLVSGCLLLASATLAEERAPHRIVSLNLCLDSVLVELVPHERILALSQYARDPWRSTIAEVARTLPTTAETAEEIVALKPDLVITSRHSDASTRSALQRIGIRFELFDVPETIAASIAQIRAVAALVQRIPEGEALVQRIERAVAEARPAPGTPRLTAAVYQTGGLTTGPDTVTSELMRIAGLDNIAARYGVTTYRPLSLESLLASPPQVLLVGDTSRGAPTQAERVVEHRALRALSEQMHREPFPSRLLYCAGPTIIPALAALKAAREDAESRPLARAR